MVIVETIYFLFSNSKLLFFNSNKTMYCSFCILENEAHAPMHNFLLVVYKVYTECIYIFTLVLGRSKKDFIVFKSNIQ